MTSDELALALLRTTAATAIAACLAMLLLSILRVARPRVHRIAWALVVLQGWLLIPWTFKIESPPIAHALPIVGGVSDADSVIHLTPSSASETPPTANRLSSPSFTPLAILAWLGGAALAACVAAARYARILRTLPLGAAPDNPSWQAEWRQASGAMPSSAWACLRPSTKSRRLHRVELRITNRLGPLLAYIPFTYLILAPRPLWTVLTSAERTAILRHELAHLRRRDLWKSLALRALALPQWFNPLVWLAVRRFDEAAEWACDDAATAADPNGPLTLANSLLHAAEFATTTPCGAVAVQGGILSRRIQRLVTPRFKEESTMRKLAVPTLLAALAAAQLTRIERVAAEFAVEQASHTDAPPAPPAAATRREYKESGWPLYIIEPPDILAINAITLVPKAPHQIEAFDVVLVRVVGAFPEHPIDDTYSVDADGTINLGPKYSRIRVAGLTIEEAEEHIRAELSKILPDVEASASLVASAGAQQITGQHLVAMDGRVNLGIYGSVYVAGLTIEETREAIEKKLAEKLEKPQVSVDVLSCNSKVYYIITKGGEKGDNVVRAPITGNETVLDAIANLGGMSVDAATKIWIARPAPHGVGEEVVLPVVWNDFARGNNTSTNYQLMPGDRLFIEPPSAEVEQPAGAANQERGPHVTIALKQDGDRPAHVVMVDFRPGMTVDDAIRQAFYPLAVDFANRLITLTRADGPSEVGRETSWAIGWDQEKHRIAADDDRELQAGDHIDVGLLKATATAGWLASPVLPNPPQAEPPQPVHEPALRPRDQQVVFKISVIRDRSGDVAELGSSLREGGVTSGDTESILGALRILRKHDLIDALADPTIVTTVGRPASIELAAEALQSPDDDGNRSIAVTINPREVGRETQGSTLRLEVKVARDGALTRGVDLHFGETVVFAVPPHDKLGPGQTYVVITPELVK